MLHAQTLRNTIYSMHTSALLTPIIYICNNMSMWEGFF